MTRNNGNILETLYAPLRYLFGYGLHVSHCAYPELSYSNHAPLFVIVVLGVVFGVIISTLSRGDGTVDLVFVGGRLQGCGYLPLLSLPCVVVAAVVSLWLLLLLLPPLPPYESSQYHHPNIR